MNHVSVLASKTVRLLQHGGERDPYHDLCAADHAFEVYSFSGAGGADVYLQASGTCSCRDSGGAMCMALPWACVCARRP